jgi:hypothetical protein
MKSPARRRPTVISARDKIKRVAPLMGADQVSEIAPAIREAIEGGPDTCVTFEVTGQPHRWVQFVDRTVNAAWPRADQPAIGDLLPSMTSDLAPTLASWEAHKYATFEFPHLDARAVAKWIDRYFVRVLQCEDDGYHVDVSIGDHGDG